MRRRFITALSDSGDEVVAVQRLAGHANLSIMDLHDRHGEVAQQKATELLQLPQRQSA
jgi:hypothetical protein